MMDLREGDSAPDFTLSKAGGGTLSLSELRGSKVILYFYPKDDTPGCTTEARNFRDVNDELESANAVVLGVSPDSVESHERFTAKYHLPFVLLADSDHQVAERYGVWVEKLNYGKKYMGIERVTFLIDGSGIISKIWRKVKADRHAAEVLEVIA